MEAWRADGDRTIKRHHQCVIARLTTGGRSNPGMGAGARTPKNATYLPRRCERRFRAMRGNLSLPVHVSQCHISLPLTVFSRESLFIEKESMEWREIVSPRGRARTDSWEHLSRFQSPS